jgi:uncharacterized membrane protein
MITLKEILIVIHLLSVALGAGGAFITDAVFFRMIWSKMFSQSSISTISFISKFVWLGAIATILSGLALFLQLPGYYWQNPQFWAKMTIVAIIVANGLVFHVYHLPILRQLKNKPVMYLKNHPFSQEWLLVSGAFSSTSWATAILLGSTMTRAWSYSLIISLYVATISSIILLSLLLRNLIIPLKN